MIPAVLHSKEDIQGRLRSAAKLIATREAPTIAAPVLVGAFVFAADLIRALAEEGLHLETEMIWLRSYGDNRAGSALKILAPPTSRVEGCHVLLIDGVLDKGTTLMKASQLLMEAGARSVTTAVAVDKRRDDALLTADYALYTGIQEFIVGYGMDDAGRYRALPYIGRADLAEIPIDLQANGHLASMGY